MTDDVAAQDLTQVAIVHILGPHAFAQGDTSTGVDKVLAAINTVRARPRSEASQ